MYLEKVVASKQLKFAMETGVQRKARLEKMVATTQLRLAMETEQERRAKNNLDLISIKKKIFSKENGNHFSTTCILQSKKICAEVRITAPTCIYIAI